MNPKCPQHFCSFIVVNSPKEKLQLMPNAKFQVLNWWVEDFFLFLFLSLFIGVSDFCLYNSIFFLYLFFAFVSLFFSVSPFHFLFLSFNQPTKLYLSIYICVYLLINQSTFQLCYLCIKSIYLLSIHQPFNFYQFHFYLCIYQFHFLFLPINQPTKLYLSIYIFVYLLINQSTFQLFYLCLLSIYLLSIHQPFNFY